MRVYQTVSIAQGSKGLDVSREVRMHRTVRESL